MNSLRLLLCAILVTFVASCAEYSPADYGLVHESQLRPRYDRSSSNYSDSSSAPSTYHSSPAVSRVESEEERHHRLAIKLGIAVLAKVSAKPNPDDDFMDRLVKAGVSVACDSVIASTIDEAFSDEPSSTRTAISTAIIIIVEEGPEGFECRQLAARGAKAALEQKVKQMNPQLDDTAISFTSEALQRIFSN